MARKRKGKREPPVAPIGAMVPQGYVLIACCSSCRHFTRVEDPHDSTDAVALACNVDRNRPDDINEEWWPWSIDYQIAVHGWCPNYKAYAKGEIIERQEKEGSYE